MAQSQFMVDPQVHRSRDGPHGVVTVAMANETARIAWAIPARGGVGRPASMA